MDKEGPPVGGSEKHTTSEDLSKMSDTGEHRVPQMKSTVKSTMEDVMDKKFREIIFQVVPQVMRPIMDDFQANLLDSVRQVVKEEIRSAKDDSSAGGNRPDIWHRADTNACLKFLDEVSDEVLTGKEIKGKGGDSLSLAITDETGVVIESGSESSAKVEILLLEASEHDNEHNWSHEDFNSRIIKENDKTKPHLAKTYSVYLDKGVGTLSNAKLANASDWTKSCKCRLGARVVGSLSGTMVKEAWTKPFVVSDSRSKLYGKHNPPSLDDPVWRLAHIGKGGGPCKRLKENNVSTVQDFLFLLSVDPQRLEKIVGAGATVWNNIKELAQTCCIDDKRVCEYKDSTECKMSVVFDVVGQLKGIISHDSQYVLQEYLSEAQKVSARKLLCSAFENRGGIIFHSNETALLQKLPCQARNASPNASIPLLAGCSNPTIESSQKAEARKLLASGYEHLWEANYSDGNDLGEWLVPNFQDSNFVEQDFVENMFAASEALLVDVDGMPGSQICSAEWELDGAVHRPNSNQQEQRAGTMGGEGAFSRVDSGNHGPLLSHIARRKRQRN